FSMLLMCLTVVGMTTQLSAQTENATTADNNDWRAQLEEKNQLTFELGYTLIFQMASDRDDDSNSLLSGSYDFGIEWAPIENGVLSVGIEGGQILSHNDDEDLAANIGSVMGINDDLDNVPIVLSGFAYTHTFGDEALIVTLGKIQSSDFFDANEIANDETTQFLSTSLVNNMTIPFPDDGLGLNLWANLSENVYVTAGFFDNNAVGTHSPFPSFADGDYFYAGEVGFINTSERSGNYRLTVWNSQTTDANGCGVAVSVDQHIASNLVLFGRWGMADDEVSDFETFVSAGIGIESPFGREDDLAAIGCAWADPTDTTAEEETIVEAFYRYQINDYFQLSPIVQAVFDPADSPESNTVYTAALRVQFVW
ncbi:MAG: carbohydrate porin, partial [Phycisphaeraceae bacterium JB051]